MKRRVAAVAIFVGACRAVVGVEDQTVVSDAGTDARADAGGTDARVDTGVAPGTDAGCNAKSGAMCGMCCRDSYNNSVADFEMRMKSTGCICGTGACATECADSVCSGAGGPSMTCAPCIDMAARSNTTACMQARTQCAGATQCTQGLSCLTGCQ